MESRRPWVVRLVFASVLIAFAAQMLISHNRAEPYPGLFQPRFSGTPLDHGLLQVERPVVTVAFADGSRATVPYKSVLPSSRLHAIEVFRAAFHDDRSAGDPRTVAWLRGQLSSAFPGRTATAMVVEWNRTSYHEADGWRRHTSPVKTVTVRLSP